MTNSAYPLMSVWVNSGKNLSIPETSFLKLGLPLMSL